MVDQDKALALLSQGISTKAVADAVGCTASYISQLLAEPAFADKLAELKSQRIESDLKFDERIKKAQDVALERIESTLPFANLGQSLGALKTLTAIQPRKESGVTVPGAQMSVTVQLQLPATAKSNYVIDNATGQLVEAGGRFLGTIAPAQLDALTQQASTLLSLVRPASKPLEASDIA